AFLGDTLERLSGAFDAVLLLVAIRRQQSDDLERTACPKAAERTSRVAHVLSDRKFVGLQQRLSPVTRTLTQRILVHDGPRLAMNDRSGTLALFAVAWC